MTWVGVCGLCCVTLSWAGVGILGSPVYLGWLGSCLPIALYAAVRASQRSERHRAAQALEALLLAAGDTPFCRAARALKARDSAWVQQASYVVLGAPRSGVHTLMQQAGLPWEGCSVAGDGGAAHCRFWLSPGALFLQPKQERCLNLHGWRSFLHTFRNLRKEAPIQGIILAVSVADLAQQDGDALRAQASLLRQEIDSITQSLGGLAPIYLLLTHCDLLPGFCAAYASLSTAAARAVCGRTVGLHADAVETIGTAFNALLQAVSTQTLQHMQQSREQSARDCIFELPQKLASLRAPLLSWAGALFQTPGLPLRGLYLTSAAQDGRLLPYTPTLGPTEPTSRPPSPRAAGRPYFVHDFFHTVLPGDAHPPVLPRRPLSPWQNTVACALTVTLCLAGAALPIVAYQRNQRMVAQCHQVVQRAEDEQAAHAHRLVAPESLDALREQMAALDAAPTPALAVWCGINVTPGLRGALREYYAHLVHREFIAPVLMHDIQELQHFVERYDALGNAPAGREFRLFFDKLKAYLLLTAPRPAGSTDADTAWLIDYLTARWLRALNHHPGPATHARMGQHLAFYLRAQGQQVSLSMLRNSNVVGATRQILSRLPLSTLLLEQAIADADVHSLAVSHLLGAAPFLPEDTQVRGGFTRRGWEMLVQQRLRVLNQADGLWVLGAGVAEEARAYLQHGTPLALRRLYREHYVAAWLQVLQEVRVAPASAAELPQRVAQIVRPWGAAQPLLLAAFDNVSLKHCEPEDMPACGPSIDDTTLHDYRAMRATWEPLRWSIRDAFASDLPSTAARLAAQTTLQRAHRALTRTVESLAPHSRPSLYTLFIAPLEVLQDVVQERGPQTG